MASPTTPTTAPYGSWPSPITPELLTAETVVLGAPVLAGEHVYWTQARPGDGGRISLFRRGRVDAGAAPVELTPDHYVRTRVHEYGGGAWAVDGAAVVFSDFPSDVLFRLDPAGPVPITPADTALRYADLRVHVDRDLVLAVREDHRAPGEPVNTVVALSLSGPNADGGRVLCSGADFYAAPALCADDRLAWVEWNHPNMPWDHTSLLVGRLGTDAVIDPRLVSGPHPSAAMAPSWYGDRLIFLDDTSGFWNLVVLDGDGDPQSLTHEQHDLGGPAWELGTPDYAVLDDRAIVAPRCVDGRMELVMVDPDGTVRHVATDAVAFAGFSTDGTRIAVRAGFTDRPAAVLIMDPYHPEAAEVVASAGAAALDPGWISSPESITWDGPQGPVQAWYHPPHHPDHVGPTGGAPPLITLSHGGPTGLALPTFDLTQQFWTSRGFAVVDVNYGGSAGFGRDYRRRLAGQWGEVDVRDCTDAVATLVARGLADPTQLVIMGGSAGGYTTLRALTATDVFGLGISLYGIGDLTALSTDTHKFESRYLDGLIGPWPQARAVYHERSPINHVDLLSCPMLILQGADDRVVPPSQAEQMAAAVRANGQDCELIIFPGEGHGFRRAENIQRTYAAALDFSRRTFGF
jgi:dipeptidyl aminopeptidase/acylaminoacyl peptidase